MEKLDQYFELQKAIYNYFGYEEEWEVFPLDDNRDVWWRVNGDVLWFGTTKEVMEKLIGFNFDYDQLDTNDADHVFEDTMIGEPLRGEEYTMIKIDTQTDGNIFLSIFDNKKEVL